MSRQTAQNKRLKKTSSCRSPLWSPDGNSPQHRQETDHNPERTKTQFTRFTRRGWNQPLNNRKKNGEIKSGEIPTRSLPREHLDQAYRKNNRRKPDQPGTLVPESGITATETLVLEKGTLVPIRNAKGPLPPQRDRGRQRGPSAHKDTKRRRKDPSPSRRRTHDSKHKKDARLKPRRSKTQPR